MASTRSRCKWVLFSSDRPTESVRIEAGVNKFLNRKKEKTKKK